MQLQNPKKLGEELLKAAAPVALLYGEDGYQLERSAAALVKGTVDAFPDFNLYSVDGRAGVDMDKVADSAQSLPFMAERRAVVLDDLDLSALSGSDAEKLWQLLQDPVPTTLLLITARTVPLDLKKKGSRGQKLFDLCDKAGVVCEFRKPARGDAAKLAAALAARQGCRLDPPEGLLLAEYCGCDSLRLRNEVDKLCAYAGEQIRREDILLLVEPVAEARIFDLSDQIVRRDFRGAMEVVDRLLFQRETPVAILTILTMAFVDIYRAASAKAAGLSEKDAKTAFGYGGGGYRYTKAAENQRRVDRRCLGDILEALARADRDMKTGGIDPAVVLETTIAEIFLIMNRSEAS